jgi:hypothetical protein
MFLELPQELVDEIIDHLHDDIPTLAACSLTCRSLLHRSRVHKLAHITIASSQPKLQFLDMQAAQYVRHLTVDGTVYIPLDLSKCPNIHWLSLRNVSFHWYHQHSLALLFPFAALDRLELQGCRFLDKSPSIARFLCGFPKLASLIVPAGVRWSKQQDVTNEITNSPPFSGDLHIQYTDVAQFIDILLSLPNGVHFKSVQLSCPAQHIESVNNLLEACGPSLRKLNIARLPWAPQEGEPSPHIRKLALKFSKYRTELGHFS